MTKENEITLSEKHGVNPTISLCFWCGEEDGSVVMLGKLPDDAKAPKQAVVHYEPCKDCLDKFDQGIVFIECTREDPRDGRKPINPTAWPTGRWAVVTRESMEQMPLDPGLKRAALKTGKTLVDPDSWVKFGFPEEDEVG